MKYEVEIDVNVDSEYNATFYFDESEKALEFIELVVRQGYSVKVCGVVGDEK